jgi:ribosomal peptide maturation radical SAM protein 1
MINESRQAERGSTGSRLTAPRILLVSMPFADVDRPSIQLGLLKAIGTAGGHDVQTFHAYLHLAEQLGLTDYRNLCDRWGRLLGDWLFSLEAFGDEAPDPDGRLLDIVRADLERDGSDVEFADYLWKVRRTQIRRFMDRAFAEQRWDEFDLVGFTSTFQQNVASIALARRIKEEHPAVRIMFGGANCDGDMGAELVRAFNVIDYVVSGEADVAFPAIIDSLSQGEEPSNVPGVLSRRADGTVRGTSAALVPSIEAAPIPDYDEYFSRVERLGLLPATGHRRVALPFESARGCWWGQKHHCTFCGLNGSTMTYRSKSPARVSTELAQQAKRYKTFYFIAVDNIMAADYLRHLLPTFIDEECDYELFYEVKANLTRAQVREMARAGIRRFQPGIESLNSHTLKLMEKGTSATQNVNLLRWALYYDIDVAWNMLWGFPGETEGDCESQDRLMPHLVHLPPPESGARIWMQRFSPIFGDRARFPVERLLPDQAYSHVYPVYVRLERLAYFFEYELEGTLPDRSFTRLEEKIRAWKGMWKPDGKRPEHTFWAAPGYVQIYDSRAPDRAGTYAFSDPYAAIYKACSDRASTAQAVKDRLQLSLPTEAITEIFAQFAERGLMMLDGTLALTLAVPGVRGK